MKKLLITLVICYITSQATGQTWLKFFPANQNSHSDYVIEDYDKGYLVAGDINYKHIWLIKTDINGNMLWNKKLGDMQHGFSPINIEKTRDHGIIISTNTSKYSANDACILKLNTCGELEWCNVIFTPDFAYDFGGQVKPTLDGGYIFFRLDQKYNTNRDNLYKFNSSGQLIWHQQIATNNLAFGEDVYNIIVDSTGIFLNGNCYFPDPGQTVGVERFYLVKTDTIGQKVWGTVYGDSIYYHGFSICSLINNKGNYISFGWRDDLNSGNSYPALVKVLSDGSQSYNHDIFNNTEGGISTSTWLNDTVIVLGGTIPINLYVSEVIMLKTDTLGNLKSIETLPLLTRGFASTTKTFDNKFVSTGFMWQNNKNVIYVIKTNSDLQSDSIYYYNFTYDSLCPHPIKSDTINPDCGLVVDVDEPFSKPETHQMRVFPNPAKTNVTITFPKFLMLENYSGSFQSTTIYHQWKDATLEIYNLNGDKMFQREIPKEQSLLNLDVTTWSKGMYIFRLIFKDQTVASEKVILE